MRGEEEEAPPGAFPLYSLFPPGPVRRACVFVGRVSILSSLDIFLRVHYLYLLACVRVRACGQGFYFSLCNLSRVWWDNLVISLSLFLWLMFVLHLVLFTVVAIFFFWKKTRFLSLSLSSWFNTSFLSGAISSPAAPRPPPPHTYLYFSFVVRVHNVENFSFSSFALPIEVRHRAPISCSFHYHHHSPLPSFSLLAITTTTL